MLAIMLVLNASEKEGNLAFWALKSHRSAGVRVCTGCAPGSLNFNFTSDNFVELVMNK